MVLRGHVSDGVIVLDEKTTLPEGLQVSISIEPEDENKMPYRRFRGSPYTYERPFEPALPDTDWEAAR